MAAWSWQGVSWVDAIGCWKPYHQSHCSSPRRQPWLRKSFSCILSSHLGSTLRPQSSNTCAWGGRRRTHGSASGLCGGVSGAAGAEDSRPFPPTALPTYFALKSAPGQTPGLAPAHPSCFWRSRKNGVNFSILYKITYNPFRFSLRLLKSIPCMFFAVDPSTTCFLRCGDGTVMSRVGQFHTRDIFLVKVNSTFHSRSA